MAAHPEALRPARRVEGLGAPRWKVELLQCRGGRPGTWLLEVCHETGGLRLVADMADGQAAARSHRVSRW